MAEWIEVKQPCTGIRLLQINRPESANALSADVLHGLRHELEMVASDLDTRVVLITGSGTRAFCAGADLKERSKMTDEEVVKAVQMIRETVTVLEQLPQPTIAVINGAAFGGGLELALACDFRLASTDALFGLTETSLGIIPGAGGTQRLPRLVGISKAKEMIFTAKRLTAEEALAIGLVDTVVPLPELLTTAQELAGKISLNAPIAIRLAKLAIHKGMQTDIATGILIEEMCYREIIQTMDRLEGLAAFNEKRKPHYRGQ